MIEYLNTINSNITSNVELIILILGILLVCTIIKRKSKKKFKKTKYKKIKKGYYSVGVKCSYSIFDVLKFKLRLCDYCDKQGIRFNYYLAVKFFNLEFCRMKYTDQKGHVSKRKIRFGR
jgi:hypothetical protein